MQHTPTLKSFVVDFKLPNDATLFEHHATNVNAFDPEDARARFQKQFPNIPILDIIPGYVNLFGKHYATFDSTGGIPFGPSPSFRHATSGIQLCLDGVPPTLASY